MKNDLIKKIEIIKTQIQKVEKDCIKVKEKLPNYEDVTS